MKDAQGYKVSGATASAVGYFDQAVRAFSLGFGDIVGLFDSARTSEPEFAMAHLGKAWVLMLANDPTMMVAARPLIAAARALELNQREEAHLTAVEQAIEGNRTAAVRILDRHLMSYPFDLLGHFAALFLDALSGRFPWVAERSSRALPVWSKSQPGYGILLAFYAFGIEEGGQYALAEENARRAAELEPNCYWAHHAIAHVMEMTGRPEDGLKWTAAHESNWSTDEHPARVHIWWHNALFHLAVSKLKRNTVQFPVD